MLYILVIEIIPKSMNTITVITVVNVITVAGTHSRSSGHHPVGLQVEGNPHFREDVSHEAHDLECQHVLTDVIAHFEDVSLPLVKGRSPYGVLPHQLVCRGGEGGGVHACVGAGSSAVP